MNALAHELATRNARVDALQASDNKRRLSSAVESIVHISGVGRAGVGGGPGGLRVSCQWFFQPRDFRVLEGIYSLVVIGVFVFAAASIEIASHREVPESQSKVE